MAVAKRQGREKPTKIEQRKVKGRSEDLRTGMRTSGRTALLTKPNLHRAGPVGRKKTYKKRSQRALSLSLSPTPHPEALFSSCLWIDVPSRLKDGFSCYLLTKIEL